MDINDPPVALRDLAHVAAPLASSDPTGAAPLSAVPAAGLVAEVVPVAPAATPATRIVSDRPRSKVFPLEWPVEHLGVLHTHVLVKRPTSEQVQDYYDRLLALPEGERSLMFPVFYTEAGEPLPGEIWATFDDDDRLMLQEDLDSFLPSRLQRLRG